MMMENDESAACRMLHIGFTTKWLQTYFQGHNFIPLNSMKGPDKRIDFSLSTYWQKLGLVTNTILFGSGFFKKDKRDKKS